MAKDPLNRLRAYLVKQGLLDDARDAALEQELNAEIAAAVAAVEPLGPPARETLFDDVYAELPWHLAEQRAELEAEIAKHGPKAPPHG